MNIGQLIATLGIDDSGIPEAEKAFLRYEKTVGKALSSVNTGIKRQSGLINDLEGAIAELREKQKGAFSIEEIAKYNRKIQEAEQDLQGYNEVGRVAESQTEGIASGFKTLAIQVIAAVATWKTFKAIMESTDTTASWFHSTIEGARTGLDYFMKSIATADFSNFIRGMRQAIRAGRDYSDMMSYIANVGREYQIKEQDLIREIEEQRSIMYENDQTALETKIQAGRNMLVLMRKMSDLEVDIARKSYLAVAEKAGKKNKLSEEELNFAIKNFTEIERLGSGYNRLNKIVTQYYERQKQGLGIEGDLTRQWVQLETYQPKWELNAEGVKEYEKAIADLGDQAPVFGRLIEAFGSVTDAEREAITQGIVNIKQAENQYFIDSRFVFRMIENMVDASLKEQQRAYEEHYEESARLHRLFLEQYEADLRKGTKEMKVPEFDETIDFRKFFMRMREVGTVSDQLSEKLANIALKNSVLGQGLLESDVLMKTLEEQTKYLTDALTELWDQGFRPGDERIDVLSEKLRELIVEFQRLQLEEEETSAAALRWANLMVQVGESVFQAMGESMMGVEKAWWGVVDTILRGAQQIITALLIEAAAKIIEDSVQKEGLYGLIIAAAGIATMIGMWEGYKSQIHSSAKMAGGGVVPPGYPNDTYPAMLTSGEIVKPPLPLGSEGIQPASTNVHITIEGFQRGEDIYYIVKEIERKHDNAYGG